MASDHNSTFRCSSVRSVRAMRPLDHRVNATIAVAPKRRTTREVCLLRRAMVEVGGQTRTDAKRYAGPLWTRHKSPSPWVTKCKNAGSKPTFSTLGGPKSIWLSSPARFISHRGDCNIPNINVCRHINLLGLESPHQSSSSSSSTEGRFLAASGCGSGRSGPSVTVGLVDAPASLGPDDSSCDDTGSPVIAPRNRSHAP